MWTAGRTSALGLAVGAALGIVGQFVGLDHMPGGHALYAAAYAAVASAAGLIGYFN